MDPEALEGWNGIVMCLNQFNEPAYARDYADARIAGSGHLLYIEPNSYSAGSVRAAIHFLKAGCVQERES